MLLNRTTLGLAKLVSKDASRYASRHAPQAIAVEKDCATVTDGHYLVTVTHPSHTGGKRIEDSFPAVAGLEHRTVAEGETVLVGRDAALGALKAISKRTNIPVLKNAAMSTDGRLVTTDLENVGSFSHKADGQFPDWRRVMPAANAEVVYETSVDARFLKALAEYFIAVGDERTPAVRLTFYKDDAPSQDGTRLPRAMRFDLRTPDGQDVTAVLMPVRYEDGSYPARPDQLRARGAEAVEAEAKTEMEAEAEAEAEAETENATSPIRD